MFRLSREKLGLSFQNVTINLQMRPAGVEVAHILIIDLSAPVMAMNTTQFHNNKHVISFLKSSLPPRQFLLPLQNDPRNEDGVTSRPLLVSSAVFFGQG
jgi:hypothetical protein